MRMNRCVGELRWVRLERTRLARHIAVLCAVAQVGACAIDSPPLLEEIHAQSAVLASLPLMESWSAGGTSGVVTDNWLATFGDAELDALAAEAIANNLDLRANASRVAQAGQQLELARSTLRPTLGFFGTGGTNMGGGDALQALSLGVSWEADLWGRLRYGRAAYEATYASVQADFEFARQSLAATLAKSWFAATETWLQLQLAESMVEAAEGLVMLAEMRFNVGIGNEQDVVLAQANLGSFEDTVKQVALAHSQALRALELLLGRYPAAELAARQDLPPLPGPFPAGLPLEMLERRPDLIAAERRVAAAFNRVGEAKAARLPALTLTGNVADLQSDILELQSDFENPAIGAGARLLAPIFQGGALRTQVEIRTLEQQEAVAQYASLALRALGDVENALAASETLAERAEVLERTVAYNERALELANMRYGVGLIDLRGVQLQQIDVYSANLSLLSVQSQQLAQRANLYLAVGGSFEQPPSP